MITKAQISVEYARDGLTVPEIAKETGRNPDAVRMDLTRAGVKAPRVQDIDHRHRVASMKPADAVEFLCDLVDAQRDAMREMQRRDEVDAHDMLREQHGLELPKLQARMFAALYASLGRTVHYDALRAAMYWDRIDDPAASNILRVYANRLRLVLKGQFRIVTTSGVGYRLERDDKG